MNEILLPVLILGGMGLIFGALLGVASKIFHIDTDERFGLVLELLPGANCGGCGKAGCSALATEIVEGKARITLCPVNTDENAKKIAEIMGKTISDIDRQVSMVKCSGTKGAVTYKYDYQGLRDCISAKALSGGPKTCEYGCIGFGSCVTACKFDALSIQDGVAITDPKKCTGCGVCVKICPKSVISLVPAEQRVWVLCESKDPGAIVKNYCTAGCIACRICEKQCRFDAIHVVDNLAVIDYEKCTNCGLCVLKCPKKVIHTSMDLSEIENNTTIKSAKE